MQSPGISIASPPDSLPRRQEGTLSGNAEERVCEVTEEVIAAARHHFGLRNGFELRGMPEGDLIIAPQTAIHEQLLRLLGAVFICDECISSSAMPVAHGIQELRSLARAEVTAICFETQAGSVVEWEIEEIFQKLEVLLERHAREGSASEGLSDPVRHVESIGELQDWLKVGAHAH